MNVRFPALLIGLLSWLSGALGQSPVTAPEVDPIAARLEEAKKVYKHEIDKPKAIIIKAFDEADAAARGASDLGLVKLIKAERAEFEATGKPPKRLLSADYTKEREKICQATFDAYSVAITGYLNAKKGGEAEKIKEERDEFQRNKLGDGPSPSPQAMFGVARSATGTEKIKVQEGKSADSPGGPEIFPRSDFGVARFGMGTELVNGVAVKVGDPQVTLVWDSNVDLDVHVIEPGGKEIFWNDRKGKFGGELDVDNNDGFGPENIAWSSAGPNPAPPGEYRWWVEYYGGNRGIPVKTRWKVRVKHEDKVMIYHGTLTVPGARSKTYTLQVEQPKETR
jgi:hypothetical protein